MNILIDGRMLTSHHGIGRYVLDLVEGLVQKSHSVTLLYHDKTFLSQMGLTEKITLQYHPLPFAHPLECLSLSRIKNMNQFDVIHFPSFAVPLKAPWAKTVITLHDLIHLEVEPQWQHQIFYKTVVKSAVAKAKQTLVCAQYTKDIICEKMKIPENKIAVVRSGVQPLWKTQNPILPDKNRIICISNTKPHKNVRTLLKACEILWKKNFPLKLSLSLSGQDLPKDFLTHQEFKSHLEILKNISTEELKNKILKAQLLVSPSLVEGYNYPAAEALSLGRKILLSKGSAHDDFSGEGVYFYEPAHDEKTLSEKIENLLLKDFKPFQNHSIPSTEQMTDAILAVYKI